MNTPSHFRLSKVLFLFFLIGSMTLLNLGTGSVPAAHAQSGGPSTSTAEPDNPYFTSNLIKLEDGTQLDQYIIHGPPHPPAGS